MRLRGENGSKPLAYFFGLMILKSNPAILKRPGDFFSPKRLALAVQNDQHTMAAALDTLIMHDV
jgi:hypothetical protein